MTYAQADFFAGHESAGEVVAVGENVSDIKVGDRVAVEAGVYCKNCRFCKQGRYNLCPKSTQSLSAADEFLR